MAEIILPVHYEGAVQVGEQRLLDFLAQALPAEYLLVPNLHLTYLNSRTRVVDMLEYDLVVVAPHGLYHLENKDWKGQLSGDDHTWHLNGRDRPNPLRSVRFKTQVLVSALKDHHADWGRAWCESAITLSHETMRSRQLTDAVGARVFSLDKSLTEYLQDLGPAHTSDPQRIAAFQRPLAVYLAGRAGAAPAPAKRRFEEDYEILETLSQSEECTEYLVSPRGLDTPVRRRVRAYAVALAGLDAAGREHRLNVIRNQYQALQKIGTAPHLLPVVLLADPDRGELYEISDYLDASTLRAELRRRTLSLPEKLVLMRQVAQGLQAAHAAQVYHRDVRPDNIFLTPAGAALLGNFSRAFFWSARRDEFTVLPAAIEEDAVALRYRARELDDASAAATPATDVYSLGLTLAETLTGENPLPSSWHDLDHLGGYLPPGQLPGRLVPGLPPWLDELVSEMVQLDPANRLPDMTAVLARLDRGLAATTAASTAPAAPTLPANADLTLRPGLRLASYELLGPLGDGGYARVWRAHHTLQSKDVAFKLYNESVGAATVRDEFRALRDLDHPHIVKFEWNDQLPDGRYFTVMELLQGPTLRDYAGQRPAGASTPTPMVGIDGVGAGPSAPASLSEVQERPAAFAPEARLPLPLVYQVAQEMLSALDYLHGRKIVHRDIKPNNIIWHEGRKFVLLDFNVATTDAASDRLHVGTAPYIAPDSHAPAGQIDWQPSGDTFALGVTLYELVCRQHPWADPRGNRVPTLSRHPTDPRTLRPDLSPAFAAWLLRAVQPRQVDRFTTAAEMLAALEAVGAGNLLPPPPSATPAAGQLPTEDFVRELNKLFSQARDTNAGTRANTTGGDDAFARLTYVDTLLDERLLQDILAAKFRLVIITGNAGDGKTAFIQKLERQAEQQGTPGFHRSATGNGATFVLHGTSYQSNYDGSQDEGDKANDQVLDEFLAPFRGLTDFAQAPEGRLLAINEGRLVEYLQAHRHDFAALETAVEAYFYQDGVAELPNGLLLVNLNLRSVVSLSELTPDEQSIFRRQVKKFVDPVHWTGCKTCAVSEQCFIRYNAQSLADTDAGDEVLRRMERLLLTVHLRRELHITMRDLRSLLAFWITRDHTCEQVAELVTSIPDFGYPPPAMLEKYYFNLSSTQADDAGQQDRLVRLVRQTDVGQRALPGLDRGLYYNPLAPRDYLPFSAQREGSLLPWLEATREKLRELAAEPGLEEATHTARLATQRGFHRLLARHQYFEGQINPDQRLPYRAVGEFIEVLLAPASQRAARLKQLQQGLAQALALLEGCPDERIGRDYIVLSVGEKDPQAQTYRLFDLEAFELRLGMPPTRLDYLEYLPDRLIFSHRQHPHVRMDISLDLFELLSFIKQGYKPSLNDLKGRFQELQLFKNLLSNLEYRQVLVTTNHRDYFTIEATAQNQLVVQPRQFA